MNRNNNIRDLFSSESSILEIMKHLNIHAIFWHQNKKNYILKIISKLNYVYLLFRN